MDEDVDEEIAGMVSYMDELLDAFLDMLDSKAVRLAKTYNILFQTLLDVGFTRSEALTLTATQLTSLNGGKK